MNPETRQFWIIDYRIYDPHRDGKNKLDRVREMALNAVHDKQLPFCAVLMDTRCAERKTMLLIERLAKIYYCPIKSNRLVDDSDGTQAYQRVDNLTWYGMRLNKLTVRPFTSKIFPKDIG